MLFFSLLVLLGIRQCSSGPAPSGTGLQFSPLWTMLAVLGLIATVFASNNTQSQVSYGLLGLTFFFALLAIGANHPFNTRLGIILDKLLSSQGLALLLLSAGIVFVMRAATNETAQRILIGVLILVAFSFFITILKENSTPAKELFKNLTGLELGLNVILTLAVIGILWQGGITNRFVRFLLYLSLVFLIPASIGSGVTVIKSGFTDFKNGMGNIPSMPDLPEIPKTSPEWLKDMWNETTPILKSWPVFTRWATLAGIISFALFVISALLKSKAITATFLFLTVLATLVGILTFYADSQVGSVPPSKTPVSKHQDMIERERRDQERKNAGRKQGKLPLGTKMRLSPDGKSGLVFVPDRQSRPELPPGFAYSN